MTHRQLRQSELRAVRAVIESIDRVLPNDAELLPQDEKLEGLATAEAFLVGVLSARRVGAPREWVQDVAEIVESFASVCSDVEVRAAHP